jgi:hypothetical protein
MKQSTLYLALCVPGVLIPFAFIIGFFGLPEPTISLFFTSIFVNHVSSAVAGDLLVSGLVFFTFLFIEGRRLGMKNLWFFVPATLFVGLSFGLPLFLYFRVKRIEQAA